MQDLHFYFIFTFLNHGIVLILRQLTYVADIDEIMSLNAFHLIHFYCRKIAWFWKYLDFKFQGQIIHE